MITVTEKAAEELRSLLERKGAAAGSGLRLAVRKGGCAGWQYVMEVAAPESGDTVIEIPGGRVIVAADSAGKLAGCRVDYVDDLSDAGFRIDNPNAARSCGCGTSFETSTEPTPEPEDCGKNGCAATRSLRRRSERPPITGGPWRPCWRCAWRCSAG